MPIVDVELKRDVPRARRGYVKYVLTAIAAVLFLHGAATVALHHRLAEERLQRVELGHERREVRLHKLRRVERADLLAHRVRPHEVPGWRSLIE